MPEAVLAKKVLSAKHGNIHIYGMGVIGRDLLKLLQPFSELKITHLYDSKAEFNSFTVMEHAVKGPDELSMAKGDTLVIASVKFEEDIHQLLKDKLNGQVIGMSYPKAER